MKIRYFSLFFIHFCTLILLSVSVTYSQAGHLQFKHLTKTEGLSSSDVLCALQDYKGYMSIGTYEGLNR
jgi:hypothetical protein